MPLESIFKPKLLFSMVRIGKKNDGGYLVGTNSLLSSKTLITFGIKNDWSFELDFIKANNNLKVICFDNQLNFRLLLRLVIQQLIFVFWNKNIFLLLLHIKNLFTFFKFKKKVKLIKKHITKNSLALSLKPTTDHKNLLGQNVNMVKNKIKVILNL